MDGIRGSKMYRTINEINEIKKNVKIEVVSFSPLYRTNSWGFAVGSFINEKGDYEYFQVIRENRSPKEEEKEIIEGKTPHELEELGYEMVLQNYVSVTFNKKGEVVRDPH